MSVTPPPSLLLDSRRPIVDVSRAITADIHNHDKEQLANEVLDSLVDEITLGMAFDLHR